MVMVMVSYSYFIVLLVRLIRVQVRCGFICVVVFYRFRLIELFIQVLVMVQLVMVVISRVLSMIRVMCSWFGFSVFRCSMNISFRVVSIVIQLICWLVISVRIIQVRGVINRFSSSMRGQSQVMVLVCVVLEDIEVFRRLFIGYCGLLQCIGGVGVVGLECCFVWFWLWFYIGFYVFLQQ